MRSGHMLSGLAALLIGALIMPLTSAIAAPISYTNALPGSPGAILDTRAQASCEKASLPQARCLPVRDLLGPHNRLANISGLLWLFGTAGLTGNESVLVIGDNARDRDFLAGLLYLAGQKQVSVLTRSLAGLKANDLAFKPGLARSTTREVVYQAAMRSHVAVLRSELVQMIRSDAPPMILDGRSEKEYWGATVRAARGGHIPGAQHSPADDWKAVPDLKAPIVPSENAKPVVYGHDARQGLAFLARAVSAGLNARVYLEGWAGWASDGALPADAATYPDRRARAAPAAVPTAKSTPAQTSHSTLIGLLLAGFALAGAGFVLGRRSAGIPEA